MPILPLKITALAPLAFSERRPGRQFRPSVPYISGSVIRGALAQQLLNDDTAAASRAGSDFHALFTDADAPLFRNAIPGGRLLPATAYSCKAESGFAKAPEKADTRNPDATGKTEEKHGVFDSLIDRLCCEALGLAHLYQPRCTHVSHQEAGGERVEAYGGFYQTEQTERHSMSPATHLVTRVALNRRRRVAEPGLLYSPLVLSEGQSGKDKRFENTVFHGSVVVPEAKRSLAREHLQTLTHVGSGASRGFGRVCVEVGEAGLDTTVAQRLLAFNALLKTRWAAWGQVAGVASPPDGTYFAILLLSHALLRADGWTPTLRLEPLLLAANLVSPIERVVVSGATLVRCYASSDYQGGWNTAWGLPKDTEPITRMGSVYVYRADCPPDDPALLSALALLEEQGVGERRQEGFGQIRICDSFHVDGIAPGKSRTQ